jgi:hypothetical protein
LSSEYIQLSEDNSEQHGDREIDVRAAEGLRLVAAFTKITHQVNRRKVIDLAERLADCSLLNAVTALV